MSQMLREEGKLRWGTVPRFFDDSYLLAEINELDQLFLQNPLSAGSPSDEHMLEQVEHVWSELKVLNQTSGGEEGRRELRALSWIYIQIACGYLLPV